MRGRRRLFRPEEEPQINLTPLIDVVFVILILFIIIAPILELDKIELADRGEKKQAASFTEPGPLAIHVRPDNEIYINQELVAMEVLADQLRLQKQRYPGAIPQLFHDRKAYFGTYQSVKNAAEAAGFEEMDVILKP